MKQIVPFYVIVFVLLVSVGCQPPTKKTAAPPPAVVTNAPKETALATVVLSSAAEQRLGVQVALIVEKPVVRNRVFGGEVMLPPGQSASVTAPFNGTLLPPENSNVPTPGVIVQEGQTLFRILPIFSVEHDALTEVRQLQLAQSKTALATLQIDSQQRIKAAQVELEGTELEWKRAVQLFDEKAGSRQMVDTAETKVKLARQTLETAEANYQYLQKATLDSSVVTLEPLPITAPMTGVLSSFLSVPGQTVVQGSVLFDVTNTESFWIRIPIYVGQLRDINTEANAFVHEFGQVDISVGATAIPIAAPPSANPQAATVDLFYELKSPEKWIRPGHKVAVTLPLQSESVYRTIPWSAVVFDIYGGSWVYQRTAPYTYVRQRVEVEFLTKTDNGTETVAATVAEAVLRRGPNVGSEIVIEGVAEIFGTEFGGAK